MALSDIEQVRIYEIVGYKPILNFKPYNEVKYSHHEDKSIHFMQCRFNGIDFCLYCDLTYLHE